MVIGYIPGVWDMLHVGHLQILQRSRASCERLVVGVPSDDVVIQDKVNPPIIGLEDRVRMLSALRCVDLVVPNYALEFVTSLDMIRPDIMFVGEYWGSDKRHKDAEDWCFRNMCVMEKFSYYQGESTTKIKDRVIQQHLTKEQANANVSTH